MGNNDGARGPLGRAWQAGAVLRLESQVKLGQRHVARDLLEKGEGDSPRKPWYYQGGAP